MFIHNIGVSFYRGTGVEKSELLRFVRYIEILTQIRYIGKRKENLGANAVKRVAAAAHLPTPWLFEPAKRADDRADYCLHCSFLHQWKHRVLVFTLEWSGARPMGEQW